MKMMEWPNALLALNTVKHAINAIQMMAALIVEMIIGFLEESVGRAFGERRTKKIGPNIEMVTIDFQIIFKTPDITLIYLN